MYQVDNSDNYFEEEAVIEDKYDISRSNGRDYFIGLIENIMTAIDKIEKTNSPY